MSSNLKRETAAEGIQPAWTLTLEQGAYLLIGLFALLSRFWQLGDHALHHDETLHAYYSWRILTGQGYLHDPLLHGPLLYHLTALVMFLFGDNNTTARLAEASFGALLPLSVWFLRRDLGRTTALIAAVLLSISPVALYVGRFARHDSFSVLFEVLVIAAILRFAATRQRRWLVGGAVAYALMFANQETSFLFLLIIGGPLAFYGLAQLDRRAPLLAGGAALLVALLVFVLPGELTADSSGALRSAESGLTYAPGPVFGWEPLATADNNYALRVRLRDDDAGLWQGLAGYLGDIGVFLRHPPILSALTVVVGLMFALSWLLLRPDGSGRSRFAAAAAAGVPAALVLRAAYRHRYAALVPALVIAVTLFTGFFTNWLGIISGSFGALLYWLAQHNVERGGQPAHYYPTLLMIYEPLVTLAAVGAAGLIIRDIRRGVRRSLAQGLIVVWAVGALMIYSWAGEKMPWLTLHMSVPLTLLAADLAARAWRVAAPLERLAAGRETAAALLVPVAVLLIGGLGYLLITVTVAAGPNGGVAPWSVVVFLGLMLITLAAGAVLRYGRNVGLALVILSLMVVGGLFSVRNAYRLAYQNPDRPLEMMVYTQTSPDVALIVERIEELALQRSAEEPLQIRHDGETVWNWYLRNMRGATRLNSLSELADGEVAVALLAPETLDRLGGMGDAALNGYIVHRMPLRWWFPEDQTYRRAGYQIAGLPPSSMMDWLLTEPLDYQATAQWWRFLMFRQVPAALGSTDVLVIVRNDLAAALGPGLGSEENNTR